MIFQHVCLASEEPEEPEEPEGPAQVCYFINISGTGSRLVADWIGADALEWAFDDYHWYTVKSTGLPYPGNPMKYTSTGALVPEQEAAQVRARFYQGPLEDDERPAVILYRICEYG